MARLDLDVDGEDNTVVESHLEAPPVSQDNPYGLALVRRTTAVRTEGGRDLDAATQRTWTVVNPARRNRLGTPVGYQLVPAPAVPALMDPSSPVFRRAEAIGHALWVTPYAAEERWPCGEFCNQSERDSGLPQWTAAGRGVESTDVVLWHVLGITHVPRPEERSVMPVDVVSFSLDPAGFDRTPALDLPAPPGHCAA